MTCDDTPPLRRPPLTLLEIRALSTLLDAEGPLTVSELRAALGGIELEDMADVLDALQAFGLIDRIVDPDART